MKKQNFCIDCGKKVSDYRSKKCVTCANKDKIGEKNIQWKGNKVGYLSLHEWIRNHKSKSMFCEKCGKVTEKLDCSIINDTYERDISKWRWLCRSCHMKSDGRMNNLKQLMRLEK